VNTPAEQRGGIILTPDLLGVILQALKEKVIKMPQVLVQMVNELQDLVTSRERYEIVNLLLYFFSMLLTLPVPI
jgi:hypothetical protein